MMSHLETFPEACPLTSLPPVRKFLFKKFPYRVRYIFDHVILLTLEHMHENNEL